MNVAYDKIIEPVEIYITALKNYLLNIICEITKTDKDIKTFLSLPSKHIRAVISFLYLLAIGKEIDDIQISYQSVIELIHNASLIHDDVIDNAQTRRGDCSLNKKSGNHIAVIGGDLVFSAALKEISKINNREILNFLSDTFAKMCQGEIDQYTNLYKIPTLEKYLEKTYFKTGLLFENALIGSLILSGATPTDSAREFASAFGVAFQINNDIKNIIENGENGDVAGGIYTAPIIFSKNPKELIKGIEKAKSLLDNELSKAQSAIAIIEESAYKTALLELTELIKL